MKKELEQFLKREGAWEKFVEECEKVGNEYLSHVNSISDAFVWSFTPDGPDYWYELYEKYVSEHSARSERESSTLIRVTAVKLSPEIAHKIAHVIINDVEVSEIGPADDMPVDEYEGEIDISMTHDMSYGQIDIDVTGTLRVDFRPDGSIYSRFANNLKVICTLDSDEIGCNADDVVDEIEKNIAV